MAEGGRQASIGGVWTRVMLRYCAVACWLTVAGGAVMVFTVDMPWWGAALIVLGLLLIMLPLGFVIWSDAAEHKSDTERLLRAGRPAVAEITGVEVV
ncbi:MAG: peptidase S8/S53 subtilisin kexin sedolisin, partial [Actinomycetota bacterium]|nr:peptidase S8/S53 subtilisin kexin sedolisin [Actinomycetota bacterium]